MHVPLQFAEFFPMQPLLSEGWTEPPVAWQDVFQSPVHFHSHFFGCKLQSSCFKPVHV